MHFKNSKLCAASEFLSSISRKFRSGYVISDLVSLYDLKRDHLFFIQNLESSSFVTLAKLIDGREAVTIYIDEKKFIDILQSTVDATHAQFQHLMSNVKKNLNYGDENELLINNAFIDIAYQQVEKLYNPGVSLDIELSSEIINLLHKISGIKRTILPFLLAGKEVLKFDIDLTSLTFAFRAFKAQSEGVNAVLDLIKLGADYEFVKTMNGRMDVSQSYFKSVRSIFNIKIESLEELSVLKRTEIYSTFTSLIDEGVNYKDAVIKTHKSQSVTIECVTKLITRFKEEEAEDLQDDLDDLNNYI